VRRLAVLFGGSNQFLDSVTSTKNTALRKNCIAPRKGDAENARNENTRHENAAPKIRGENGKSET